LNDDRKGRKVVVLGILVLAILIGICVRLPLCWPVCKLMLNHPCLVYLLQVAVIFTSRNKLKSTKETPVIKTFLLPVDTEPDQTLQGAVTVDNIFAHLSNFDTIARTGGLNSRSVATNYNLSGLYVMDQLSSHGVCEPQMQVFAFPIHKYNATPKLQQLGPLSIDYISGDDFIGMNYGGNGTYADETAPFFYVNTGCEAADYEGIPVGSIVGADYVGCDIYFKAKAAQNSSMTAILIMNPEGETTLPRFLVNVLSWQVGEEPPIDTLIQMPVFAVRCVEK